MSKELSEKMKRIEWEKGNMEEMREGINRVNVKKCEDLVMKMEIEKEEKGSENIVREIEEKDILKLRK